MVAYLTMHDGGAVCFACANDPNVSRLIAEATRDGRKMESRGERFGTDIAQWYAIGVDWTCDGENASDVPVTCDHCYTVIGQAERI